MKNIKLSNTIKEYLFYNIIGTCVFIICQLIYLFLLFKVNIHYTMASIMCTFVASILNYFFNSYITFKNRSFSFFSLLKVIFVEYFQSIPSFIILVGLVEFFCVPKAIASIIPPVIMTPIMFIFSKKILGAKNHKL